ncbi:MAG TPA: hypothetical protein VN812_23495, partial [Candidatus Acidoferrales bacterium]|nr:hypothetical protein [Candidatus Acidoferrales bacterium]
MGDERRGHQRITRASLIFAGLAVCLARGADAQEIGRDVTELHPCLYGDCEARGTYAADPFGFTNPATMPVGTLTYMSRGLFVSGSHFRFNAGGVGLNIDSPSVTVAVDPWVFQASVVYAEGGGAARSLPGTHLSLRTRLVRLATAVDLGRTALGITGLSVGLLAGVPGTTSELRLTSGGLSLVDSRESHEVGLTGGVHWRGGRRDWFNVGAFVDAERHHESMQEFDPMTLTTTEQHGVSNAWFARAGLSLLPFVPLGLTE